MSPQDDTKDVVDAVLEDHEQIRILFTEFENARPDERADLWQVVVRTLAVHETAEEEIVHPQVRRFVDGGDDIVDELLGDEDTAKKTLADLENLGPDAAEFAERFTEFRRSVLTHASREELEELTELRVCAPDETRHRLGALFIAAKSIAPTHGHKLAPESAVGNVIVGPVVAVFDRVRDAIRDKVRQQTP